MRAPLVEEHSAFLVHERLQKLELCFRQLNLRGYRSHVGRLRQSASLATAPATPDRNLLRGTNGFRGLLESFNFLLLQEFANVQQNNQAALQLSHSGDVT